MRGAYREPRPKALAFASNYGMVKLWSAFAKRRAAPPRAPSRWRRSRRNFAIARALSMTRRWPTISSRDWAASRRWPRCADSFAGKGNRQYLLGVGFRDGDLAAAACGRPRSRFLAHAGGPLLH